MCGICGIFNFEREQYVDRNILIEMRDFLTHRGPDDAGLYIKQNVGLGHRRLSIIDIASGHQPLSNEQETAWIVFNGEIYNYLDLRNILISKGHIFKTNSDTEVILHAYEQFGLSCLEELRGMFAFAIWDEKQNQLFLARDRLGEKPLYYSTLKDSFLFGSEIKSILLDERVKREVDEEALYYYLSVRYVPGPRTMFKNIWKLQPGHYILIKERKVNIHRYWDLSKNGAGDGGEVKSKGVEEEFINMLEDCIRMRLMSEVPLGVFLSGGIDSSTVVALMSKLSNKQIKTFCVGSEEDFGVNEFKYARMIAEEYDTDHHEFLVSGQKFYDFIPRLVWHMDEPISDPAAIPLFYLSRLSREYVTVVLSGEGADEILAGYYIYKKMLMLEKFRKIPEFIRENLILNLIRVFLNTDKKRNYAELAKLPLEKRYKGVSRVFMPNDIDRLYKPNNQSKESLDLLYGNLYAEVKGMHPLNQMLYVDIKTWLPDDLLMKADKMTMATSQELRVPFLDHKLVEFAFSLPPEEKISKNITKYLLRKVSRDLIPKVIISREKRGFLTPVKEWFKGDLNDFSKETLLDPSSACREYFDRSYVSLLLENHKRALGDFSEQIWNLLVFEHWHRSFIKTKPSQR